jgi:hypothetical protein
MDKGTIIIVLIIIVLVVLPLVLPEYLKKTKAANQKKRLIAKSKSEGMQLSELDVWDNCCQIGIDKESKRLIYSNKNENNGSYAITDLSGIGKCVIVRVNSDQKSPYGGSSPSYRLYLVLTYADSSKNEKVLEFYNNVSFSPNETELSNIQKWSDIISSNLNR